MAALPGFQRLMGRMSRERAPRCSAGTVWGLVRSRGVQRGGQSGVVALKSVTRRTGRRVVGAMAQSRGNTDRFGGGPRTKGARGTRTVPHVLPVDLGREVRHFEEAWLSRYSTTR